MIDAVRIPRYWNGRFCVPKLEPKFSIMFVIYHKLNHVDKHLINWYETKTER